MFVRVRACAAGPVTPVAPAAHAPAPVAAPPAPAPSLLPPVAVKKVDWYQTPTHVTVSILAKGAQEAGSHVTVHPTSVSVVANCAPSPVCVLRHCCGLLVFSWLNVALGVGVLSCGWGCRVCVRSSASWP